MKELRDLKDSTIRDVQPLDRAQFACKLCMQTGWKTAVKGPVVDSKGPVVVFGRKAMQRFFHDGRSRVAE